MHNFIFYTLFGTSVALLTYVLTVKRTRHICTNCKYEFDCQEQPLCPCCIKLFFVEIFKTTQYQEWAAKRNLCIHSKSI